MLYTFVLNLMTSIYVTEYDCIHTAMYIQPVFFFLADDGIEVIFFLNHAML